MKCLMYFCRLWCVCWRPLWATVHRPLWSSGVHLLPRLPLWPWAPQESREALLSGWAPLQHLMNSSLKTSIYVTFSYFNCLKVLGQSTFWNYLDVCFISVQRDRNTLFLAILKYRKSNYFTPFLYLIVLVHPHLKNRAWQKAASSFPQHWIKINCSIVLHVFVLLFLK